MGKEVWHLFPLLLQGAQVTLGITFCAAVLAFAIAVAAGLCRISKSKLLRGTTAAYVEIFRGTSLLIQLFWVYFALPFLGISLNKFAAAVLVFALNYGAYGSEIVRSAILAVPKGQREAAVALNMTPYQTMVRIIFPQALLRMLPPFGNLLIEMVKGTSLVYFIALTDLTYQAMLLRSSQKWLEGAIFILLLILYFLINTILSRGVVRLENKLSVGRG